MMRQRWADLGWHARRLRGSAIVAPLVFVASTGVTYLMIGAFESRPEAPAAAIAAASEAPAPEQVQPTPAPEPAMPSRRVQLARELESSRRIDRGDPPWLGPIVPASLGPEDSSSIHVLTGRIAPNGTLAEALDELEVSPRVAYELTHGMRPVFDFRGARPGDFFTLIIDPREEILSFEFQRGRSTVYRLDRDAEGRLRPEAAEVPLERRVLYLSGVIDRSLFDAVRALGETPELVQQFADIFMWDLDFSTQTRPGDEFRVVFEKYFDRDGFVRYGTILAAEYRSADRRHTSIYFEDEDGYGDYYTPEGNSVRRSFLRAPVKFSRISSRYTRSRFHPILKVRRPHLGVDYAAPSGTPVWAVADGEVIFKGWNGGFGRLLKIRHNNGFVSYYGHLRSYANGLSVGSRVRQKQVIGRVGSSGLSTGPHVDFRLRANGRFVDPLKVRFPQGKPVSVAARSEFERVRDMRLRELDSAAPSFMLEARGPQTLAE